MSEDINELYKLHRVKVEELTSLLLDNLEHIIDQNPQFENADVCVSIIRFATLYLSSSCAPKALIIRQFKAFLDMDMENNK